MTPIIENCGRIRAGNHRARSRVASIALALAAALALIASRGGSVDLASAAAAAKPSSAPAKGPGKPAKAIKESAGPTKTTKSGKGAPASAEKPAAAKETETAAARRRPMVSKPTEAEVAAIKAEGPKVAVIETARGRITIELLDDEAPMSVANFVKLSRAGFYDGLTFHRVVKEPTPFVVQGGDPLGNGMGGPGYMIEGEFTKNRQHVEGTVAMARAADPNSAGSQFYICLAPAPNLDGQYAIFGQVTGGMDAVLAIVQGDIINRVTIEAAKP